MATPTTEIQRLRRNALAALKRERKRLVAGQAGHYARLYAVRLGAFDSVVDAVTEMINHLATGGQVKFWSTWHASKANGGCLFGGQLNEYCLTGLRTIWTGPTGMARGVGIAVEDDMWGWHTLQLVSRCSNGKAEYTLV